jgi:ATP-dependent Lon protease
LRDRIEIIPYSGYTEDEKVEVAKRHLVPTQLEAHGLSSGSLEITDQALIKMVRRYTWEADVRNLERAIATLCRKVAHQVVGEDVLFVEAATTMPGKGTLTGQLGEVMKESAQAALSYCRANAGTLGIEADLSKLDVHIHVPGAVLGDRPSAGLAMTIAFTSALTGPPVKRSVAMTGEITLRGRVLPSGA